MVWHEVIILINSIQMSAGKKLVPPQLAFIVMRVSYTYLGLKQP